MRSKRNDCFNFSDIIVRFENDIDLLKQKCNEEIENPDNSDNTLGELDNEKKFSLAMKLNQSISYTISLPYTRYYKFRKKCFEEGYSIQEGFNKLIENFVEGKLLIKED